MCIRGMCGMSRGSELLSRKQRPPIGGVVDDDKCDPCDCDIAARIASGCDTDCCDPSGCDPTGCDTDDCDPCGCDMDRCDPCNAAGRDPRGSEAGGLYVGRTVRWPCEETPG
uniref:Keratin-associated protein 5-4-like n=1 Tax=Nicotiana tabacum TaxID=4097 RepID=A0A1S4DGH0_TOBAC